MESMNQAAYTAGAVMYPTIVDATFADCREGRGHRRCALRRGRVVGDTSAHRAIADFGSVARGFFDGMRQIANRDPEQRDHMLVR